MDATELTLRPTNGTPDGGASSNEAPAPEARSEPPSLQDAVATLPLSGSGELTRVLLAPLAETGDVAAVVSRCADELDWLPGLAEVLRTACQAEAEDPSPKRSDGIDTLCDLIAHHIDLIVLVLRGAYAELEPSTQAPPEARPPE